ncbi:MAG TPA: ABC transporter ATP-binding protein [Planctomycetota bacterium]|nr:ABC transporter ATP-binding protein [Planctomycetota bacterium]
MKHADEAKHDERRGDAVHARAPRLVARGLKKRFGKRVVLAGVDLEVAPGLVTALLGENGQGKTTLMKLALGVLAPDGGTITVAGFDPLKQPRPLREQVGFVPAQPDAYGWMTVRDLFRFLAPQYPTWDRAYAEALVQQLRIPEKTTFKAFSRGEGMKAMLAAALAPRPPLLLLDEPFAGLDPLVREEVLRGVIGELRGGERTVLLATHDLDVVARVADRVAILADGRIRAHGTLEEVLGGASTGDDAAGSAPAKLRDALESARRESREKRESREVEVAS